MNTVTCCFDEEAPARFDPSRFAGRRLLVAGAGGGADCVTAWALATWLLEGPDRPASVIVANAKARRHLRGLEPLSEGGDVYAPVDGNDDFFLDTRLPDGQRCLILRSPEEGEAHVIRGLDAFDFDHVLVIDTGADIVTRKGRDWRTFQALRATGKPVTLALVCPGSDGQELQDTLRDGVTTLDDQGTLVGHQPAKVLERSFLRMKDDLGEYARRRKPAGEHSTPVIAQNAFNEPPERLIEVEREKRPLVPARWLQGIWFFDCPPPTAT